MELHEALNAVKNKETFLRFVQVLIEDRETAEQLEREEPKKWAWGGANGWQNSSISTFLECASCYFTKKFEQDEEVSWRDLANFLHFGKIYE